MANIDSVASSIASHPFLAGGAVLGTAGAIHGWNEGKATSGSSGGEPTAYSANRSLGEAGAGVAVAGATVVAYAGRDTLKSVAESVGRGAKNVGSVAGSATKNYIKTAVDESLAQTGFGKVLSRGPVAIGMGAAIGGLYTAYNDDDPAKGLAVGAAAGAIGFAGYKASKLWSTALGALPPKGTLFEPLARKSWQLGLLATAAFAAAATGHAMAPPAEVDTEGVAQSDGTGGYETSTVRSRMETIGATGDIVFGLHNRR